MKSQAVVMVKDSGTPCTLKDSDINGGFDAQLAGSTTVFYVGPFTAGSSYTLTQIGLSLKKEGTPTDSNIVAKIYDTAGIKPVTTGPLATSTNSVNTITGLTTSFQEIKFQFAGVSLTNATEYWLGLYNSGTATDDASNNIHIEAYNLGSGDGTQRNEDDTTGWSNALGGYILWYRTYSGACP
ncbi:MAG: hypothetical protein ACXAD7_07325 [Candidatus Kariarchaeaceae archaeon]